MSERLPRLEFQRTPFLAQVLPKLRLVQRPYRPTPWLFNAHLQILWSLVSEALSPPLKFDGTLTLAMRDGGTTALHWLDGGCSATSPTLVVLHGIAGDAQGVRQVAADLKRATGWRVVVCTRRGHGKLPLTAPRINTLGCTGDLNEQLTGIQERFPGSPLYAVGVSAGSGLLVRYLGEEGRSSMVRAGVAYCPAYAIPAGWSRVQPFYSRAITKRLRRLLLEPRAEAFAHLATFQACRSAQDLEAFHEDCFELAGFVSQDEYVARCNPMGVFERIAVPVMILNADDDPVCVAQNVIDHLESVRRTPDAVLVRTDKGGHCAFFEGWWPRSWANRAIGQYLLAAHEVLERSAAEPMGSSPSTGINA